MTLVEPITPPSSSPPRRRSAGAIVAGAVGAFVAAGALSLGGLALWGDSKTDDAGYLSTGSDTYATSTYAIATDDLDVGDGGWQFDHDMIGKIRLRADSHNGKPVFVGIARTDDVDAYLRQSPYAELTDVDYSPFHADYRDHAGDTRPAAPADQGIWVASTHGPGTQTLNWDVEGGEWSVVVMNADASQGVDAGVSAGARIGFLEPLGWSLLGGGVLMLAGAAVLLAFGVRRR